MTSIVVAICFFGAFFSGFLFGLLLIGWFYNAKLKMLYCVTLRGISVRGPVIVPVVASDPDEAVALVIEKHPYGKVESVQLAIAQKLLSKEH